MLGCSDQNYGNEYGNEYGKLKSVSLHGVTIMAGRAAGSDEDRDSGLATAINRPKVTQPPLYKVILLNDDYTPMDFVVEVLCSFFLLNAEKATQIMLKVHTEGKAVCGVFSKDVAETKAQQVNDYSRECEQPLLCNVEVDR